MNEAVAADTRSIFHAEDLATAQTKLAAAIEKYSRSAPQLATWTESNLPEGFTVFAFPEPVRKRLRTANLLLRFFPSAEDSAPTLCAGANAHSQPHPRAKPPPPKCQVPESARRRRCK